MSVDTLFGELSGRHYLDGRPQAARGERSSNIIDPATEQVIGHFTDATPAEVDHAVQIANAAQKRWNKVNYHRRAELLHEVAQAMRRDRPVVAEMLTREMGKPYKESADEVSWSVTAIDYYAEIARHELGKVLGPTVDAQFHFTIKEPLGVVVIILPFNYPLCLLCWQAAAAVASGNAVIIKPSDLTTLTTLRFIQAFDVLPPGVVQVLAGGGSLGAQLVTHPDTHMIAFTGGIDTGRTVAESCARLYKRALIETSGNDPFLVMPSAPIDTAARAAAFGAYLNCGQVCAAAERFYVHEKIYDAFVERLIHYAGQVRIGNGLDKVDMGPLASERELSRYQRVLRIAREQGIRTAIGGGRPPGLDKGFFAQATVLVDVPADAAIMGQESFGPVAPVSRVGSFDEAVALANRSRYGLGASIYTLDLPEAMRAINEIEAGMVWVNAPLLDNDAGPFGGRKYSGMGRQLGSEGLDSFRHTKLAMIDPAANPHDFWWFPYTDAEACPDDRHAPGR
ncbi:MAG TPA: aldehyde dehydrogenase family protein [Steroidobacteraceae bacterium]|jgi:acyl-CoA reductase-like NAD-dependent aldehyde dehydrogenase|nr:aldehyde dehydrogenase family protein [Steroidobacteraceae bacterium]